jgi:hypothetical protein
MNKILETRTSKRTNMDLDYSITIHVQLRGPSKIIYIDEFTYQEDECS